MRQYTGLGFTALAMLAVAATPAAAQLGQIGSGKLPFSQNSKAPGSEVQRKPSGLPGARGGQTAVAPAERSALDMRPTEALFDAVNRGDIASARDAISRGAELDGRNILGLTPLELAIDLGRNELTFLLLSMRGASGAGAPPAETSQRAAAPARPAPAPRAAPARPSAATPVATAPRVRQNGAASVGTPAPQAGFLGFGSPSR